MSRKLAYVDAARCDRSPACPAKRSCPQKAITQNPEGSFILKVLGGGTASVDRAKCTGCGRCVNYCPQRAIAMIRA